MKFRNPACKKAQNAKRESFYLSRYSNVVYIFGAGAKSAGARSVEFPTVSRAKAFMNNPAL